ncbi:F-box only protein 34 isoform X1 [Syngnathus typhle]|uniref:F-box only protein 34 isoform X1 n=1 Tax=Syngnathus typhle TaxID=161592 RepID=UPI002A6A9A88|nr:F-box only protein 34 isoform X1 [Syngnathus typhle]XP_061156799.1 F-box only protein 34 isoform X1 [Syngnathus typhle]XP_061156800.1 F-box only protein 34 isoform X1 [Syngnathus typhle]XP_061156801.1 F-box only protein 34 isoform X1 [Syngnathus typhle]XP_061156802.1 F-box only protein 34 isoform X1 [Syngnathus typhle]
MHIKQLRSGLCVDVSGFRTPPRNGRCPLSAIPGNTLSTRGSPPPLRCPAKDDPDALLDVCAVIKPGHVREKIALFASDPGSLCANRAPSTRPAKVKGSWRENNDGKRRRRSGATRTLRRDSDSLPGNRLPADASTPSLEQKVSVGAIVAFLEERRSGTGFAGTGFTVTRTPPLPEDTESVRVSDVVAKIECLQRRNVGGVSTSPRIWARHVRVTVCPVCPAPSPPSSPSFDAWDSDPIERSRSPSSAGIALPPPSLEETEPLPGLLFLSTPPYILSDEATAAEQKRASDDFAEIRQRLSELLEPPVTLATLPQDVLLGIFVLLPTRSLAALKCTCSYFKLVIENYGVRPADSLWVADPRYHNDPCKKCKRRYGRGDVSLCRWHHKPYCQALPFGPGFWLCCHRLRRDAPGCNMGLHDNRWVPTLHS